MATAEAPRAYPATVLADGDPRQRTGRRSRGAIGTKGPLTADFLALRVRPAKSRGRALVAV